MQFTIDVESKAFNKHIKNFSKTANISVEKIIKKLAFDLLTRIIKKNPVDTGRSRAGWYVAMEKLAPFSGGGSTGGKGTGSAEERAGRAKGRFIDHTKHPWNKWIEIINGVDYIIYLEYGHSKQAPYGMVRVSMRELRRGQLPKNMSDQLKKDWNKWYGL